MTLRSVNNWKYPELGVGTAKIFFLGGVTTVVFSVSSLLGGMINKMRFACRYIKFKSNWVQDKKH